MVRQRWMVVQREWWARQVLWRLVSMTATEVKVRVWLCAAVEKPSVTIKICHGEKAPCTVKLHKMGPRTQTSMEL